MSLSVSEVNDLVAKAKSHNCSFPESCDPKNKGLWKKRAARSTDVVITNKSKYTFKLMNESKSSGVWTETMLPVADIKSYQSVLYGCQSRGFMTGCTECTLSYKSSCGKASFTIYTSNPFVGGKHAGVNENTKVTLTTNVTQDNNNFVCFNIV